MTLYKNSYTLIHGAKFSTASLRFLFKVRETNYLNAGSPLISHKFPKWLVSYDIIGKQYVNSPN